MATTYTTNLKLAKPATDDTNWDVPLLATIDALDAVGPLASLAVTPAEVPSTSLNVRVGPGNYRNPDGTIGTYAGTATQAVAASSTKHLYLDASGALVVGSAYPSASHVRLATVTTDATAITGTVDDRIAGVRTNGAATSGTATLVAGAATVSTAAVTASTRVFLTAQTAGGTQGNLRVSTRTAGTSFAIASTSATETSIVAWLLIEP